MAYSLWSQDVFSKGELSPFMYARATVNQYSEGLKTAQNVLTYPTGAAGKRFGTLYQSTLTNFTAFNQIYFETFQYLNECVYQILFTPGKTYIYLEGFLIAAVDNSLSAYQIYNMIDTVLGNTFRITGIGFKPLDLTRSISTTQDIVSFSSPEFTAGATVWNVADVVIPVQFSVSSSPGDMIMETIPPISPGVTYFIATTSTTTGIIFSSSQDAKAYLVNNADLSNAYTISSLGTGTTSVIVLNAWALNNTFFKSLPFYDFNGATVSYDALTFTPSAATGSITITVSGDGYSKLDATYIGGVFIGGGGSGRITAVASHTSFTVSVSKPFVASAPIIGSLAYLAEPAWSDVRGWPQVCSSYQNRALFANTSSLPNGFWTSVINDYADFGDLTNDDDDAISWYPTSNNMNYIRFIVPYRSITVHTNTGIYSSPLSDVAAITPSNFTLQLQDSTPADVLQPEAIDNQILVLSGNDAHQMLWDGINNAYTSDIVSVINEQTIRNPVDETAYYDLRRAGSRFVFIINEIGTMAVFQTLLSQNVSGFTIQMMEQSYGNAQFLQAASSSDGRCWFVVQRDIAQAAAPVAITGFTLHTPTNESTLHAVSSNFIGTAPTAMTFTTTGVLPASTPAVNTNQYYWAIGVDADNFIVYLTHEDAINAVNEIQFTSSGMSSNVVSWELEPIFTLEELSQDVFLDCAVIYNGTPSDTVNTGVLFNAQDVKMVGDGFGFDAPGETNVNNEIVFEAHGSPVDVSNAYIGFPINTIMEPMPLSLSNGNSAKQTTLTKPKRVNWVRFMFNNTIGGTINGVPIALQPFDMANIGEPPAPARGIFEMSIFKAWDDFNNPTYTIEHSEPFNIQLLGAFYSVEI